MLNMTVKEFFDKYSAMPLHKRFGIIDLIRHGTKNLVQIHEEIVILEQKKKEIEREEDKLLKLAHVIMFK